MEYQEDTEMQLEELEVHDEATQLQLLVYEVEHLQEHGEQPSAEWFEARFLKIYAYSELHWEDLSEQFKQRNQYLSETAHTISEMLKYLITEWETGPVFDLNVYDQLLHEMNGLWKYYSEHYMNDGEDDDILDVIAGMSRL